MAHPDPGGSPAHHRADTPDPRILCDTASLAAGDAQPGGALWRLAEPGRQLDANIVRVPPGRRIPDHVEPHLDVLVLVVAGTGTLDTRPGPRELGPGSLAWLPHGSVRGVTAGADGLSYLTVHQRRPGMRIQPRPET